MCVFDAFPSFLLFLCDLIVIVLLLSSNSYFLNADIIIDRYLTLKISDKVDEWFNLF